MEFSRVVNESCWVWQTVIWQCLSGKVKLELRAEWQERARPPAVWREDSRWRRPQDEHLSCYRARAGFAVVVQERALVELCFFILRGSERAGKVVSLSVRLLHYEYKNGFYTQSQTVINELWSHGEAQWCQLGGDNTIWSKMQQWFILFYLLLSVLFHFQFLKLFISFIIIFSFLY